MRFALQDVSTPFLTPPRPLGPHDTFKRPHSFRPWLCHAQSGERKHLPASSFSEHLARLLPWVEGGLRGARATICWSHRARAQHQPGLRDPSPSFWQLSGLGEPGLGDLAAVPSAHRGLVFLCLSGAHPGCQAEGPLSFNTRGSHCPACASSWQRILNQEALSRPWLPVPPGA